METLLKQIADQIQCVKEKSQTLALKEILFSGIFRSGFSRDWAYLEGLDEFKKGILYSCFLRTDNESGIIVEEYLKYIEIELLAYGESCSVKAIKDGIEILSEDKKYGIVLFLCEDADPKSMTVTLAYQSVPLPYEARKAIIGEETKIAGIRKEFEKFIASQKPEKRGPGRPKKQKPPEPEPEEKWRQPSLFDF